MAEFRFVSEDGELTGWNPTAAPNTAILAAQHNGAIYKGLTLLRSPFGPLLLATDFHNGRIDVYDGQFHRLALPRIFFHDRHLPAE